PRVWNSRRLRDRSVLSAEDALSVRDLRSPPVDLPFRAAPRRWFETNVPKVELKTLDERREWHRTLFAAGYVGMGWPREDGGQAASALRQAIVADEMARGEAPPPPNRPRIGIRGPAIIPHGPPGHKQRQLQNNLTAEPPVALAP